MNAQNNGLFKSTIQKAINSCQAIIIHEYQSSSRGSSMKCRDRHILPIKIKGDMVLCFDISLDGAWRIKKEPQAVWREIQQYIDMLGYGHKKG